MVDFGVPSDHSAIILTHKFPKEKMKDKLLQQILVGTCFKKKKQK